MNLATQLTLFPHSATSYTFETNSRPYISSSFNPLKAQKFMITPSLAPLQESDSRADLHSSRKMAFHRNRPACILASIMVISFTTLADAQTTEYLDPHNAARAEVGSPPLTWSARLADYARSYATTQLVHCLPLTHSDGGYGENLFWGSAGKAWTPLDAVTAWTDEVGNYDHERNACKAGKMCGHYTQVVWTSTTHVGCAVEECSDGSAYFICSYDPPGNWIGERPFHV